MRLEITPRDHAERFPRFMHTAGKERVLGKTREERSREKLGAATCGFGLCANKRFQARVQQLATGIR